MIFSSAKVPAEQQCTARHQDVSEVDETSDSQAALPAPGQGDCRISHDRPAVPGTICSVFSQQFSLYDENSVADPGCVTKMSGMWAGDSGSRIRRKPNPVPGVKEAPDPGSATLSSNFQTIYGGKEPSRSRVIVPARQAT